MRVLIAMPSLGRGGAERHSVYLARSATDAGHEVTVVTLTGGGLLSELEETGIPVVQLGVGGGLRGLPAVTRALDEAVRELRPDVISGHDVSIELGLRGVLARRWVPTIVWKHTYGHIGHRGLRERLVESTSGHLVARYGAVCHTQVRYLSGSLGIPSTKITALPNTVPLAPVAPWPEGPFTVAMVATTREDKGHDDALAAWERVVATRPEARLLLAGGGPRLDHVRAVVHERGLTRNVEVLGEVADPLAVVERAHALLLASYNIECFPYVALEAMSLGRPVVSTDVGGLPEMVDDRVTGMLVPPRDAGALAAALTDLAASEASESMGQAGRERLARCYPMQGWRSRAVALLEDVASTPKGARR